MHVPWPKCEPRTGATPATTPVRRERWGDAVRRLWSGYREFSLLVVVVILVIAEPRRLAEPGISMQQSEHNRAQHQKGSVAPDSGTASGPTWSQYPIVARFKNRYTAVVTHRVALTRPRLITLNPERKE